MLRFNGEKNNGAEDEFVTLIRVKSERYFGFYGSKSEGEGNRLPTYSLSDRSLFFML